MKVAKFLLIGLIVFSVNRGRAQPPDSLWSRTYGGPDDDYANCVQQTADGGYVLAGTTWSFGWGSDNMYLVKTDANGIEEWSSTFGGNNYDEAYSVQQTADGGYVLAGLTGPLAGPWHLYLVKTDEIGDRQWSHTFGGSGYDLARSVQQTTDGGYVLAGFTWSFARCYDMYLVRTDGTGDTLWTRTFGGTDNDLAYSVQQTTDGGYILAGITSSFGTGLSKIYLVKTDENGDSVWTRTLGGSSNEGAYAVQQTTDGGFVLAGTTDSFDGDLSDMYLVKTDGNGNAEWSQSFGGSNGDFAFSVQQTTDGGFVSAGFTTSFGAGGQSMYVVKTDGNGNPEWSRTFGGMSYDRAYSLRQTTDGAYVLAGFTNSFGAGAWDMWLVKMGPDLWIGEDKDRTAVRHYELLSVYPNPFNPVTTITFSMPRAGEVKLVVYDLTGRQVEMLADQMYTVGEHQVRFDGSELASGIYFARLEAGKLVQVRKIVLLK